MSITADLSLEEDFRQLADEVFAEVCQQRHVEGSAGEEHAAHQALAYWCIVWNKTQTLRCEDMGNTHSQTSLQMKRSSVKQRIHPTHSLGETNLRTWAKLVLELKFPQNAWTVQVFCCLDMPKLDCLRESHDPHSLHHDGALMVHLKTNTKLFSPLNQ